MLQEFEIKNNDSIVIQNEILLITKWIENI